MAKALMGTHCRVLSSQWSTSVSSDTNAHVNVPLVLSFSNSLKRCCYQKCSLSLPCHCCSKLALHKVSSDTSTCWKLASYHSQIKLLILILCAKGKNLSSNVKEAQQVNVLAVYTEIFYKHRLKNAAPP